MATIRLDPPRGPVQLDLATKSPIQNIYIKKVEKKKMFGYDKYELWNTVVRLTTTSAHIGNTTRRSSGRSRSIAAISRLASTANSTIAIVAGLFPECPLWVIHGLAGQSRRPCLSAMHPIGDKMMQCRERSDVPISDIIQSFRTADCMKNPGASPGLYPARLSGDAADLGKLQLSVRRYGCRRGRH